MFKITLLSLALLTIFTSTAIAPALAEIAKAFPASSPTTIKFMLTTPALVVGLLAPFAGKLSRRFGDRRLLIGGLVVYLIGGLGGAFAPTIEWLFFSRVILGFGVGVLLPMSSGLITRYYSANERLKLMGLSSSANYLFSFVSAIIVGYVTALNWRYGFLVYATAFLVLALVISNIPKTGTNSPQKNQDTPNSASSNVNALPFIAYLLIAAVFLQMVCNFSIPTNIALFIEETELGGSKLAGWAVGCLAISGVLAGALTANVRNLLGRYFAALMLLLNTLSFFMLAGASTVATLIVSLLMSGLASGFLMPYLIYQVAQLTSTNNAVSAMGLVAMAAAFGQFGTPLILDGIVFLSSADSISSIFWITGLVTAVFCVGAFLTNLRHRSTGQKKAPE